VAGVVVKLYSVAMDQVVRCIIGEAVDAGASAMALPRNAAARDTNLDRDRGPGARASVRHARKKSALSLYSVALIPSPKPAHREKNA
jgi:hypothetical protein